MSCRNSILPDPPIPFSEVLERRLQRMRAAGIKVLHGSERLLIAGGLICILVYVCTRIYATAMYQAGLWSFSQLNSGSPTVEYENHRHAVDFSLWG